MDGILVLAADLIDLIDIDDALLAPLHIPIGVLQQAEDDVLDIFADVSGFGERRGIDNGKRHVQNPRKRLRQQRLAGSRRADQQDVRLRKLDVAAALLVHLNPLVVVVDRYRELLLGGFLPDHVLVEVFLQFQRLRQLMGRAVRLILAVVFKDRIADGDAFIANVGSRIIAGGGDQLTYDVLTLVAKGTTQ